MSAAQLLNPKAESRVSIAVSCQVGCVLIASREEEKLSELTLMLVRACKMF